MASEGAPKGGGVGGVGSIVVAVLMSVLAPVVGYAVVRDTAMGAAGPVADLSSKLPPPSVMPRLKAIMRESRRAQDDVPAGAIDVARRAAVEAPLAFEPYFIAARVAEQAGRYNQATTLMEEARRRRPNATSVRVALLGYYSLAEAYQKAVDEADVAMRINGNSIALILPAFAKLVGLDPKARQAIAVSLSRKPPWREAFFDTAATSKMEPAAARALVADIRRLSPARGADLEEAFLIRALVASGEYREARALWESLTPAGLRANAVTDGNFRGLPALAPFNWKLASAAEGSAEIVRPSENGRAHLAVDYFGDAPLLLAEQTMAAAPGNYRLISVLTGEGDGPDLEFNWEVYCLPAPKPIATLKIQPFGSGVFRRETPVTIPATGCAGQSLALVGRPGEVPRTLRAEITSVALTPVGRARR